MNVKKVIPINNVKIRPTEKKIKKAEKAIDEFAALPKEMPIERDTYIRTEADEFEASKNSILISITNMLRGNK